MKIKGIRVFSRVRISCILIIMLCFGAVTGVIFYHKIDANRYVIAQMAPDDKNTANIENVKYYEIWFTFRHGAKGIIVVYRIENNGNYSNAYWIPLGRENIMLWK